MPYVYPTPRSILRSSKERVWENMAPSVVKAEPACSKPPASVGMRIFMGKRRDFGDSAPWSTRASLLHFVGAEGPANSLSLKLVWLVWMAAEVSQNFSSSTAFSIRMQVFMSFVFVCFPRSGC